MSPKRVRYEVLGVWNTDDAAVVVLFDLDEMVFCVAWHSEHVQGSKTIHSVLDLPQAWQDARHLVTLKTAGGIH